MMEASGRVHALAHQLAEVDCGLLPSGFLVAGAAGPQHLFHRLGEAIRIAEHQAIKPLLLRFCQLAALQGLQMQADGSDRRFQLVGNGVYEAVVLFAAANLTQQKCCVHDHARNN